jgi:hypothetical protein
MGGGWIRGVVEAVCSERTHGSPGAAFPLTDSIESSRTRPFTGRAAFALARTAAPAFI